MAPDTYEDDVAESEKCGECNGRIVYHKDEHICEDCGLVYDKAVRPQSGNKEPLGSVIDGVGPSDWKNVTVLKKRHKTMHEEIANEDIGYHKKDADEIESICSAMDAPDYIVETAIGIFNKFKNERKRGCSGLGMKEVYAGSILAAYREYGMPMSGREIGDGVGVWKGSVFNAYKKIITLVKPVQRTITPESFVPKIMIKLGMPDAIDIQNKACEIIREAQIKNHTPDIIAAGAVHRASIECKKPLKQIDISQATSFKGQTIREVSTELDYAYFRNKNYKKMEEELAKKIIDQQ